MTRITGKLTDTFSLRIAHDLRMWIRKTASSYNVADADFVRGLLIVLQQYPELQRPLFKKFRILFGVSITEMPNITQKEK